MKKVTSPLVTPVLKWVGGKRQLLNALAPLLPPKIDTYCEPFIGGGALLFHLQPSTALINDVNPELIRVYQVIQQDVEALIHTLASFKNEAAFFYHVRNWDRDPLTYAARTDVEKAARTLYLNKTCYNGLFRVNRSGQFNSPFGRYKNPKIIPAETLRAVSAYFHSADIRLSCTDYADVLAQVPSGSFVYLDPPYDPVSPTASFTSYAKGGFSQQEQIRLRECCDALHARGIPFMLSNSDTDFIREQYAAYHIVTVQAKRSINSQGQNRGAVNEVVVRNYE